MTEKSFETRGLTSPGTTTLRGGLTLRPARWSDLESVVSLIYDVCKADGDVTVATSSEDMTNAWSDEGFNVERDAFIVETQDGRLIGYEEFFHSRDQYHELYTDGYVHPDFKGFGIGRALLYAVEARAREEMKLAQPDLRVFIRSTIDNKDEAGHNRLKAEGYFPVRYHWRIEIKMQEAPAPVAFTNGIELRPFIKEEHATAVWQADNEAFRDHWAHHDSTYVDWSHRKFDKSDFERLKALHWRATVLQYESLARVAVSVKS